MQRLKFTTYTADGTWLAPAGVAFVLLFGRGGSAGGTGWNGFGIGGGGCWSIPQMVAVTPNTSYAVTIGLGSAGTTSATPSPGGDTTFGSLATFKGAQTGGTLSQGLTFGGNMAAVYAQQGGHYFGGGQKSPFAPGGDGYYADYTLNFGGGGGGDGYGGVANGGGVGGNGWLGGGGGGGSAGGGSGTDGRLIVSWVE